MTTKQVDVFPGDFGSTTVDETSGKSVWTELLNKSFSSDQGFLSGLSGLYDNNVVVKKGKLDETLEAVTKDASSPEALAKYQAALAEYTLYRNAQSNAVKAYKDVAANTIRNFN